MPPDPPDRFTAIPRLLNVARALGTVLDDWMGEYLAAIERQDPTLQPGDLERPATTQVRHAGIWRRAEQTPAVVVWPERIFDQEDDPEGNRYGAVHLGVLLVAAGQDEANTTELAETYADAARTICLQRPIVIVNAAGAGEQKRLRPQDEDYTAVDVDERGRVRAGVTLSYHVSGVYLGNRRGGPPPGATPRPDPTNPWPAGPTIDTVFPPDVIPTRNPLG